MLSKEFRSCRSIGVQTNAGDRRQKTGDRRRETGDRRMLSKEFRSYRSTGVQTYARRQKAGDGRRETECRSQKAVYRMPGGRRTGLPLSRREFM